MILGNSLPTSFLVVFYWLVLYQFVSSSYKKYSCHCTRRHANARRDLRLIQSCPFRCPCSWTMLYFISMFYSSLRLGDSCGVDEQRNEKRQPIPHRTKEKTKVSRASVDSKILEK
eukprot:2600839-Amphidinium_carterae.1